MNKGLKLLAKIGLGCCLIGTLLCLVGWVGGADIGAAKKKLEDERDSYKTQLETATQKLEGFKDVNVEELNGKIETLTGDVARL